VIDRKILTERGCNCGHYAIPVHPIPPVTKYFGAGRQISSANGKMFDCTEPAIAFEKTFTT
jgi:hypothetical protein